MMSQKSQRKYETFTSAEIQYLISLSEREVEVEWNQRLADTQEGLDIYNDLKRSEAYGKSNKRTESNQ